MKNILINTIGACLLAGGMASCSSDELIGGKSGEGYIQLSSVDVDKNVQVRNGESEVISVDILNADGSTFQHADDWTAIKGESFLAAAGTVYNVKAYSFGKTLEEGFEAAPYYTAEQEVTVKAGVAQTVDITCRLAQSMVNVNYSDNFKSCFSDYSCRITGSNGTDLTFASDETRSAYVKAGQSLTASITLTPTGGTAQTITQEITASAEAATRYKINYDVNIEGTGNITVVIDQNRHEYEVTLDVPLKPDGVSTTAINGKVANVWGQFAILEGQCTLTEPASPVEFKYRKSGQTDWSTVAAERINETSYYQARIQPLDFNTEYEYKIVCGETEGDALTFITEQFVEVPNLNFDTWTQNGKNWYANPVANNLDAEDAYWATGNEGVTSTLAGSKPAITERVEGSDAHNGYAAKMHTITGITLVGSAAGNLFIGTYKTNFGNPSASVNFGRPYNGARPVKLKGYYKYSPQPIDNGGTHPGTLTTDECNIYLKVWDEAGNEIGFGEFVGTEEVTEYTPFEFDIVYSDPSKKAAKMTIVATSSHYGGVFSGSKVIGQVGTNSTLWIDDFELSYY